MWCMTVLLKSGGDPAALLDWEPGSCSRIPPSEGLPAPPCPFSLPASFPQQGCGPCRWPGPRIVPKPLACSKLNPPRVLGGLWLRE